MQPFDHRAAEGRLGPDPDLALAARVFAVIGGVTGYATDMVDHDLPDASDDFERWVAARVLSPSATLHHEATTLLAEDPTLAQTSPALYHSVLGAIANGSVTAGNIANRLRRSTAHLDPALKRLIAAGFVVRHEDPIRARRATYALADPLLQFHYAVLEPHRTILRDRPPLKVWQDRLSSVFDARVRGPVFEELARAWVRRYAAEETIGGPPGVIGPSQVTIDGRPRELDVVIAEPSLEPPNQRAVRAIGEAKAGETVGETRLRTLERARAALGPRAAHAKLLLFAPTFTPDLRRAARARPDLELVDPDRLYHGE